MILLVFYIFCFLVQHISSKIIFINPDIQEGRYSQESTRTKEMILKYNGTILESSFVDLDKVQHLSLIKGYISKKEIDFLEKLINLESLEIIRNEGNAELSEEVLNKMTGLKTLVLHLNKDIKIKENALRNLVNLEVLSMDNQSFHNISAETFASCRNLKYLRWNNGYLGKLDANTFRNMTKLVSIHFENINLKTLMAATFKKLPFLKVIGLAKNKLTKISGEEFQDLPNLEILHLEKNLLIEFNAEYVLRSAPNLKFLGISSNKFSCEKKLKIQNFLLKFKLSPFEPRETLRCSSLNNSNVKIFSS